MKDKETCIDGGEYFDMLYNGENESSTIKLTTLQAFCAANLEV